MPYEPETLTAPRNSTIEYRKTLQKRAGSKDYLVRGRPSLSTQAEQHTICRQARPNISNHTTRRHGQIILFS